MSSFKFWLFFIGFKRNNIGQFYQHNVMLYDVQPPENQCIIRVKQLSLEYVILLIPQRFAKHYNVSFINEWHIIHLNSL